MKKIALFLLSLLAIVAVIVPFYLKTAEFSRQPQLNRFSSYEELKNFLKVSMGQAKQFENLPQFPLLRGGEIEALSSDAKAAYESAPEHSTTNIQVAGVDEADIVKTDGEYLYVVSGPNIYILKAYPPNQTLVLSKIELNETYGAEIYVNEDKLAVLGNRYQFVPYAYPEALRVPYAYTGEAFVKVYDLTDRANPNLTRTIVLNGTLSGSRMIGNYVYAVVNQPATGPSGNDTDIEVMLPRISGNFVKEVQPTEVRYVDVPDVFYYFTTVVAVNAIDDAQEPTYEPFLTGQTALMYVSLSNMYLVVPNTNVWILRGNAGGAREETLIYRVKLDRENIVAEAEGAVLGYVLNQFSMDEYNGFFRIATTKWTSDGSKNNLFILNMSLNVVGKLEGLAPGERIYSARFMGDRCYLVTFRQIDPFFVIYIGDPVEPKVLGYLKIPGFSGYLHPYDENYIIGIGKQGNNVKLSLFDVTNVTAPTETAKYVVQADWSDSTVLMDHKAFLFDKSKQLLALPVSISWIWVNGEKEYYSKGFWQGAYVFNISLEQGFTLKGNITHQNGADQFESGLQVKRILYIDNVLYTISDKKIKMNSLENLNEINEVELP
jgi:inhibitor of cysteine peptidase